MISCNLKVHYVRNFKIAPNRLNLLARNLLFYILEGDICAPSLKCMNIIRAGVKLQLMIYLTSI
jgi:hypothetical protein